MDLATVSRVTQGDAEPRWITHACHRWLCGRYRTYARWTGSLISHCSSCGELFSGEDAFIRHQVDDASAPGGMRCLVPGDQFRADGSPKYVRIEHPTWRPDHAWRWNPKTPKPGHPRAREYAAAGRT